MGAVEEHLTPQSVLASLDEDELRELLTGLKGLLETIGPGLPPKWRLGAMLAYALIGAVLQALQEKVAGQ